MDREQMILDNEKLIYHVLKKLNLYNQKDDLYDVGMIALIKGVDTYNPSYAKPSTYLYKCIKNAILIELRKKRMTTISIETIVTENLTLEDMLADPFNLEEHITQNDLLDNIYKCLEKLSQNQQYVIINCFGLFNNEILTQKQVAVNLNTSQPNVSRILKRAIKNLKREVGKC